MKLAFTDIRVLTLIFVALLFFGYPVPNLGQNEVLATGVSPQPRMMLIRPAASGLPSEGINAILEDSDGFLWIATTDGLCRYDGYSVLRLSDNFLSPLPFKSNFVTSLAEDGKGHIIAGTNRGLYLVDRHLGTVQEFPDTDIAGWRINTVCHTTGGELWVSTNNQLLRYDAELSRVACIEHPWQGSPANVSQIYEDPSEAALWWVVWTKGIVRYDLHSGKSKEYVCPEGMNPTALLRDYRGMYFWVSTLGGGVMRLLPDINEPQHSVWTPQPASFSENNNRRSSESQQARSVGRVVTEEDEVNRRGEVFRLCQDARRHRLWTVAFDNLYVYDTDDDYMLKAVDIDKTWSVEKKNVDAACPTIDGNIWMGGKVWPLSLLTFSSGADMADPVAPVKDITGFAANLNIVCPDDNGYFWVNSPRGGFGLYHRQSQTFVTSPLGRNNTIPFLCRTNNAGAYTALRNKIVRFSHSGHDILEETVLDVSAFLQGGELVRTVSLASDGTLLLGTSNALLHANLQSHRVKKIADATGKVVSISQAGDGTLYITSEERGIIVIGSDGEKKECPLPETPAFSATDTKGLLWIGTMEGNLYSYDTSGQLTAHGREFGLSGQSIRGLQITDDDRLWIMTATEIISIGSSRGDSYQVLAAGKAGLENFLCMEKDAKGNLYVGGQGGFVTINSQDTTDWNEAHDIRVRLTEATILGERKMFNLEHDGTLRLPPSCRETEVFFSTLDLTGAATIHYAFRIKGGDWTYLRRGQNHVMLTGLEAGHNRIEVKATDAAGSWSLAHISCFDVYVQPYWYETWWARCLGALLLLALIGYIVYDRFRRLREKDEQRVAAELEQMKLQFFTNISHELRTPLTLIITPLSTLIRQVDGDLRTQLTAIYHNANNLLSMVNQLLDFRKMERGGETLHLQPADVSELVTMQIENFRQLADERHIALHCHLPTETVMGSIDADKVRKILSNLLSNAFKFTPEGGKVAVTLDTDEQNILLIVEDTGSGIAPEDIKDIWKRFYQSSRGSNSAGTGIGLHMVHEYATLHGGDCAVESKPGEGTTFIIRLPLRPTPQHVAATSTVSDHEAIPTILLVEDNVEFRTYLRQELSRTYRVCEAADGEEGLQVALREEPDIIVTDLMMPRMDGIELCRHIRHDLRISHTPVILLTASQSIDNQRLGYKEGADAYISKPFDWEILMARIQHLLLQQQSRQKTFQHTPEAKPEEVTLSPLDEQLLAKAVALVEKNLNNSDYTIEDFASDMAMSRVSLFRKLRSLTGLSPTDFIRTERLKHAANLILQGDMNIVAVANSCGFNTPSYFTKAFKNLFGVLPSEYKGDVPS